MISSIFDGFFRFLIFNPLRLRKPFDIEGICIEALVLLDFSQLFEIKTNLFQFMLDAMLKKNGHIVAYHFETFSASKTNYSI